MAATLKRAAKQWVRPLLIPVVRPWVRYLPYQAVRHTVWNRIVEPYMQCANYSFSGTTQFRAVICGNTEDVIQRYIFYFGVWEPNLTHFLSTRLREGDVFVDVGANIGYFALCASKLVGNTGKVIAIEASPTIFNQLLGNLQRNRTTNVEALNTAASEHAGNTSVFLAPKANIGETSTIPREGFRYECDVPADTLDNLLAARAATNVRMIKIDVEGGEWSVVAGMRGFLRTAPTHLEVMIELRPESLGHTADEILGEFRKAGFLPYRLDNDYSALSHMSRDFLRPARIRSSLTAQTDVIFSRIDADFL